MSHSNVWNSHPKTYGPGSHACGVCRNPHAIIRKHGLICCRQCFRSNAKEEEGIGVQLKLPTNNSSNLDEEFSLIRPPLYTGIDYKYWKMRMLNFLLAVDVQSFLVIPRGAKMPMMKDSNGAEIPKPHFEWTNEELMQASQNAKALNHLLCSIDRSQINKLPNFENAYELWKSLEMLNERTSQVNELKINWFMCELDSFKMKAGEEIEQMISRFTMITNQLSALGKSIDPRDQVKKILRSLPKEYRSCTSSIKEANNQNTLKLDDLVEKLLEFEMKIKIGKKEEDESKIRKNIALKTRRGDDASSSDKEEDSDDELVHLINEFRKFLKSEKLKGKSRMDEKKEEKWPRKHKKIICYECEKSGHIATDCPLRKFKRKFKKKAMKTTLSDSDSSSSEEEIEERTNLALMTSLKAKKKSTAKEYGP